MSRLVILDGAMGTGLQAAGLAAGENPSVFGMRNPEIVAGIHKKYIEAGSKVILTNTFTANADKLKDSGEDLADVVASAVKTAKSAVEDASAYGDPSSEKIRVALDIGPIGTLLEPYGSLKFEEAYEMFADIVAAGAKAGADLIYFETFSDLAELRAGILAANDVSDLPVWATMSFEASGRTFLGTSIASMALTLDGLGVEAMGINCSLGPNEIYPLIEEMQLWTSKKIIVKPNAGLPDPSTGLYSINALQFGEQMKRITELGVFAVGGCCGTTPEFISELAKLESIPSEYRETKNAVCSASDVVTFDGTIVIGERINPTGKKRFQQALKENDMNYIMSLAIEQEDAGADILDINVGYPDIDEVSMMTKVVRAVQSVVNLPLQIDSSNPEAIEAGLRACNGRAIVNSVDASDEKLDVILPIVKKYGAAVVGLAMGRGGMPRDAEERVMYAETILERAREYGISERDVIIDCLALTISAQQEQMNETLEAMRRLSEEYGCKLLLGVSNISFGLPARDAVNKTFLAMAIASGLNFAIINPNNKEMMDVIFAARALKGEDKNCEKYIERFSGDAGAAQVQTSAEVGTIEEAVRRGLRKEVADKTRELLAQKSELDIVNTELIPALEIIGREYEEGKLFLPQLINSANAAKAGFDVIKGSIASKGDAGIERGTIVLATVEGDIHDIGKNIVKVVLENYGFKIIDLGKDVPPTEVVKAVREHDVRLVGLSALMTTTVPAMEKTIKLLREDCDVTVMVGGAVLTKEYAEKIGADYYTSDATASVHVAEKIFG